MITSLGKGIAEDDIVMVKFLELSIVGEELTMKVRRL